MRIMRIICLTFQKQLPRNMPCQAPNFIQTRKVQIIPLHLKQQNIFKTNILSLSVLTPYYGFLK